MRNTFLRFDEDGSGETETLELGEVFRHLGYSVNIDDLHVFVKQVDVNGSGELDFREFLCLMRMHREKELVKIRDTFDAHKNAITSLLAYKDVVKALDALDYK